LNIVVAPYITTFMILNQDEATNTAIFKESIDKNKKSLE
jgi:hypothetical protein